MPTDVIDNPAQNRFELKVGDELALAYYKRDGDRIILTHTEVPQALSGQGIGSRLAAGAFAHIREDGNKAVTQCSFMAAWSARHPEVADLVVG
ncbi:GNAT family N-acetyltransferase [Roseixanthobacter pseudopolyaromaticivorans]|uniref:GNAT family N-acetyltransferase n=1 Tax=Xanthobacteraceae TaxID=335928 RepID=UPI00372A17CF